MLAPAPALAQGIPGLNLPIDQGALSNPAVIEAIRRQIEASGQPGRLPQATRPPLAQPGMGGVPGIGVPGIGLPGQFPAPGALPAAPRIEARQPSTLELVYSRRLNEPLLQFGYDMLRGGRPTDGQIVGAVPEGYVLGVGDQLVVTLRGNMDTSVVVEVDREGRVSIPGLPPLPAANRTYGDFRQTLDQAIRDGRLNTQAFVSLGQIRQIAVVVGGQVNQPGVRRVPALATVLDALIAAGGVDLSGSLRAVRVNRRTGSFVVDLYDLLLGNGIDRDITLLDGDQVIVPTIGATVAIGGAVKRAGIYELPPGTRSVDGATALLYAGGPIVPTGNVVQIVSSQPDGQIRVVETRALSTTMMREGDLLALRLQEQTAGNTVGLAGAVLNPGTRGMAGARSVRELIPNRRALSPDAYLAAAVHYRPQATGGSSFRLFDLGAEIGAAAAARRAQRGRVQLREGDQIIVLTQEDVRFLASQQVQSVLRGDVRSAFLSDPRSGLALGDPRNAGVSGSVPSTAGALDPRVATFGGDPRALQQGGGIIPGLPSVADLRLPGTNVDPRQLPLAPTPGIEACRGLRRLASIIDTEGTHRFAESVVLSRSMPDVTPQLETRFAQACPPLFDQFPDLLPLLLENAAILVGEVLRPGLYPIPPDVPASRVVAAAGGFTRNADLAQSEIARLYAGAGPQAQGQTAPPALPGQRTLRRFTVDLSGNGVAQLRMWPGDVLRIQSLDVDRLGGVVVVEGELRRPGVFEVRRGERLSDVMRRAGGLTPEAYPIGAVFTRASARAAEQQANIRAAAEFEQALATTILANANAPVSSGMQTGDAYRVGRDIAAQLRTSPAIGRLVVEADPAVLATQPDKDILLEPGDRIIVPRRPLNITVIGAVLNPGSVRFDPRATVRDYVRLSGGYRDDADSSQVFVVLPNGEARPVGASFWNFEQVALLPGSTIVVPRDAAPLRLFPLAIGLGDILSKLAITAASIAVIGRGAR
ncbi:MAG: SLBB domain-containing protein [Alphaproteobacteria bacterium]|nr:SLBB domain-containing protein [Alphaproteobacteria bacterium]